MKLIDLPTRQPVPFATSGTKNAIPATQPVGSPGRASYNGGFPDETMQPIASGGTPPFGQDFNGLFFDVTNELRWAQAGGTYTYDSTFATAVGGYPAGAVLKSSVANVLWINTVDDNTTDPDGGSAANWVAFRPNSGRASLAVVSGTLIPTAAQLTCNLLSVTGDATSLTTNLRLPLVAGASYLVNNATTGSGATLNVSGATGTGVTIAQGKAQVVFSDGTNYYVAGESGAGVYLPINGTAVAATRLATARAFNLTGVITATAQNFDGTGNVTLTTVISDAALSIAKTNGLQSALDSLLPLTGGTLIGDIHFTHNIANIYFESTGLVTRYRINANINDSVDGGLNVQTWDGSAWTYCLKMQATYSQFYGNLIVQGTCNVQGSDRRIKRDVVFAEPRPLHRQLRLCDYVHIDSGEAGRGVLAQDMQKDGPEYVHEFDYLPKGKKSPVRRLGVDYSHAALELAMWAAGQVDELRAENEALRKRLSEMEG